MVSMIVFALLGGASVGTPADFPPVLILDFGGDLRAMPVNDTVMGGVSASRFERGPQSGVFSGVLSLDRGGGFASMRFANPTPDLSGVRELVLSFRGDGRTYQLRLRDDQRMDGVAWRAEFETADGEWREIRIPLDSFMPTFRGQELTNVEPLRTDRIHQIAIMLADKNPGPFRLELGKLHGIPGGEVPSS